MNAAKGMAVPEPYVKFYPCLLSHFGSRNVPLIIGRLEYWFANQKFRSGFFKFLEPCAHYLYRKGDSWTEELNISRKLFNKAFDLIGVRYKSKTQFEEACQQGDPFRGKLYASYLNHKTHQMHYVRNHAFVDTFLKSLFSKKASDNLSGTLLPAEEGRGQAAQKGRHCDSLGGRHPGGTIGGNNIQQKNTSNSSVSAEPSESVSCSKPEVRLAEEMKKIWEEEVGDVQQASFSLREIRQMQQSLQEKFQNSLQGWRQYCRKIASSQFLMGEKAHTRFKAWFHWAIRPDTVERIETGFYTLGDRKSSEKASSLELEKLAEENVARQPTLEARDFHHQLLQEAGAGKYYHWFRDLRIVGIEGTCLMVKAPTKFIQSQLETRYSCLLADVSQRVYSSVRTYRLQSNEVELAAIKDAA